MKVNISIDCSKGELSRMYWRNMVSACTKDNHDLEYLIIKALTDTRFDYEISFDPH